MNHLENAVSIHPYFKIRPGNLEAAKALLPAFIKKASTEPNMLYYGFSLREDGNELFCREAYADADALLAHIDNVGPELEQLFALSDLARLEVHGPAAELEKLRGPLGELKPTWFTWVAGAKRP